MKITNTTMFKNYIKRAVTELAVAEERIRNNLKIKSIFNEVDRIFLRESVNYCEFYFNQDFPENNTVIVSKRWSKEEIEKRIKELT